MGADEIEAYVRHRLGLVGWAGRPEFTADAYDALFRFTAGVPRRLNQMLNRLLLHGSVEQLDRLDRRAVEAVAEDLEVERPRNDNERVLPLRAARADTAPVVAAAPEPRPAPEPVREIIQPEPSPEPATASVRPSDITAAARIAALESRLDEQEAMLRRALTLLVDWAERDHGQDWDQQAERRSGRDRRFHAV
jgi:hypothetical protein